MSATIIPLTSAQNSETPAPLCSPLQPTIRAYLTNAAGRLWRFARLWTEGLGWLVIVATIISVSFATRGAMAANRPIVEVLHFVGAGDSYIANRFLRHFLRLGLEGGVIGGGIVGIEAGNLISEICLAIEMGADAIDIGKTIHPHPTLSESIGMAAEVLEGVCTDLPPQKRT